MNDVVKLSELISNCARGSKLSFEEAVYDLYRLAKGLRQHHERQGKVVVPDDVSWVGGVASSKKSLRVYKLFYSAFESYFDTLCCSLSESGDCISSYCETDSTARDVPVSLIYVSLSGLERLALEAGLDRSEYLFNTGDSVCAEVDKDSKGLREIELNKVSVIITGLIQLIKEVDKAHSVKYSSDLEKRRAESIRRAMVNINGSTRKNYDICNALKYLADDAGVEMRIDLQTFKRYMRATPK